MDELARLRDGRRSLALIALAGLVAVVFLAVGSVHGSPASDAARISQLEAVLKCPPCDDLSIGQSTDPIALDLDQVVHADVHAGMSNAAVEAAVLAKYPAAILEPQGGIGALALAIPIAAIVLGGLAGGAFLWRRRRRGPPRALTGDG